MALSQKYIGKVLTPWFDLAEWKTTRELIYSDSLESQLIALDRLKVWKVRTPLLSVGVEGTLLLLEALLEEQKPLTEYQIAQIFSTALLRFLNICAASNDRQGTFYKTAEKNDLPYWLITLRHEIAHDHKVPSKAILKCAIVECFAWIKTKYWEVQDLHMKDYVIIDETNFKELMYNYAQLNLLSFFKENTDTLISDIEKKFPDIFPHEFEGLTTSDILLLIQNQLLQSVTEDKIKDSSALIISVLIEEEIILGINYFTINDKKKIPPDFIHIWLNIINLLYQNETLFMFINKLADLTESMTHEYSVKEIASLWIAELYQGFLKTRKIEEEYEAVKMMHMEPLDSRTAHLILESMYDNNPEFKDTITFHESGKLPIEDSKLFQDRILRRPNEYTMNYLELVLKFNRNTNEFIKAQCKNIKKLVQFSTTFYTDPITIHTVEDLKGLQQESNCVEMTEVITQNGTVNCGERKFRKLTDAEKFRFKGYPLGLMPPRSC